MGFDIKTIRSTIPSIEVIVNTNNQLIGTNSHITLVPSHNITTENPEVTDIDGGSF